MTYKPLQGFIALFSAITLSGLLLILITAEGLSGYLANQAIQDERSYRIAQQAAFSCSQFAFSRLDSDPLRFLGTGSTTIQFESSSCDIVSASTSVNTAGALIFGYSGESSVPVFFTANRASSSVPFRIRSWAQY